jgi:hypothetical protein
MRICIGLIFSEHDAMTKFCEHGNIPSEFIRGGEFFTYLCDCVLLNNSTPCSQLVVDTVALVQASVTVFQFYPGSISYHSCSTALGYR